jgi:dipeptidase
VGGVVWFGAAAAHATSYIPVMVGVVSTPDCLAWGYQGVFNTSTAFWAHRNILTLAQSKFDYMISDIRQVQSTTEHNSQVLVNEISSKYTSAAAVVTEAEMSSIHTLLNDNAEAVVIEFRTLLESLLFKYADNYINFWTRGGGFQYMSLGKISERKALLCIYT